MSTRIIATLASVSTALFFAVGCAASPEGAEDANTEASANEQESKEVPSVETNGVKKDSTGYSCGCPAGQEMQAGLCYPTCQSGYSGDGPVCWQTCASGFTDTGWFCQRNTSIISANNSHCPWYDKCGVALKKGCSTCPSGYSNDGCTCRRDAYIYAQPSYGRGAGTTPSCSSY